MLVGNDSKATIDAKPEPITIDLGRAAVLAIDMQIDFGAKGGMFDLAGIDLTPIRRAVPPTDRSSLRPAEPTCRLFISRWRTAPICRTQAVKARHTGRLAVGQEVTAPDGRWPPVTVVFRRQSRAWTVQKSGADIGL
jgi:ureidoacrylate peracid hydrolase